MPGQSQLLARIRRRQIRKVIAVGDNGINGLLLRQSIYELAIGVIAEDVLVGISMPEPRPIVAARDDVPTQSFCLDNQGNFRIAAVQQQ